MQGQSTVVDAVPQTLRNLSNWCRWYTGQTPSGKPTKRPDQNVRDLARCRSWVQVRDLPRSKTEGIGFLVTGRVLLGPGVLLSLDLDACVHPDGHVSPWAQDIVVRLDSYTSISPSGTGLHLWVVATDLPASIRALVLVDDPGIPGVAKKAGLQVFGSGPAGYVTEHGVHLPGTPTEIRSAEIGWLLDRFGMRGTPGQHGDGELPTGKCVPPPSLSAIDQRVRAEVDGDDLVDAQWQRCKPTEVATASEVYWRLVVRTLRCAQGHGRAAVDYLLARTAWGRGQVDDSRDPGKYARPEWVAAEVIRAGAKVDPVDVDPASVFAGVPLPELSGAPVAPRTPSPLDDRWLPLPPAALTARPADRRYLLARVADTEAPGGGVLPMGQVAFLSAEGGVGKTLVLLQLAVCIATGRPWIGYEVDPAVTGARSVLLLAEEDAEEAHRRLYWIAESLGLSLDERAMVAERVVVVPLAGIPLPLAAGGDPGSLPVLTAHYRAIEERLSASMPLGLVVLDPLARLFPSAETSNELATFAVQACERIARRAPGAPVVIAAHHSSKMARRMGAADARGVSGLTDGARTSILMRYLDDDSGDVELAWGKANLHARHPSVRLSRCDHGLLRVSTGDHREAQREKEVSEAIANLQRDADAVVKALRAHGPQVNRRVLAKLAGIRGIAVQTAIDYARERGMVAESGTGRRMTWSLGPNVGAAPSTGRESMFD